MSASKRKYVRLEPSLWAEIEALWETGDSTLPELQERFGVSRRALQAHFSKNGIIKGAKAAEMAASVKAELFEETLPAKDATLERAREIKETTFNNAVAVEKLIMAQLADAQKDPTQAHRASAALKALSLAAAGLERLHSLKWRALGLDKDSVQSDELPILYIRDLTPAEIKEIQQGQDDDFDEPIVSAGLLPVEPLDEGTTRSLSSVAQTKTQTFDLTLMDVDL